MIDCKRILTLCGVGLGVAAGATIAVAFASSPGHITMRPGHAPDASRSQRAARLPKSIQSPVRPLDAPATGRRIRRASEWPQFDDNLPVLYGSLLFADWMEDYSQCGYYAFQPKVNPSVEEIAVHPNLAINGGGAYSDRRLHYHLWEMYTDETSETGITFHNYYCVVNTDTWSFVNVVDFSDYQDNISYDMTYDPVTQNLYSLQWGPYESDFCDFSVVDKTSGEATPIAKIPQMVCLASDNFGNIFSVGSDGNTYRIDKSDGSLIMLGASGVENPAYMQSATVDPERNVIYWAASTSNGLSALYRLDTHSGCAVKITDMPHHEEFSALFVEAPRLGLDAPAEVTDFRSQYGAGMLKVSFAMPAKAFDGSTAGSDLAYHIYVDGTEAKSASAAAGSTVETEIPAADGRHTVVVYASNDKGDGPGLYRSVFTGNDAPGKVENLLLRLEGLDATLTWDAPTVGRNGGSVDPAQIEYTVCRYPGGDTVSKAQKELRFEETLPAGTATYYYTVTGTNPQGEGVATMSNTVFMGQAFEVPYSQDFEDDESLAGFTIINSEEGRGWFRWHNTAQNFKAMAHKFTQNDAADGWLILPAVNFEADTEYKLQFNARVFSEDDPEKFEVTIGTGASPDVQTRKLLTTQTIKNTKGKLYEIPFTVDAAGAWNIAIHCVSPVKSYYLIVDDLAINKLKDAPVALKQPLPVTNPMLRNADNRGRLELSWTAPVKDVEGGPLRSEDISYRVYDNAGTLLADGIKETSYTDTRYADLTSQKMVYYQVHAINGDKESDPALSDMVLAGPDLKVPFLETFAGCQFDNNPWVLSTVKGTPVASWGIGDTATGVDATPADNDGGMVFFRGAELPSGYEGRITSAKVNLGQAKTATAKFWVYVCGGADSMVFEVTHNDHVFTPLLTIPMTDGAGWKEFTVEIPAEHLTAGTSFAFHGIAAGGRKDICVDHLNVTATYDAGVEGIAADGLKWSRLPSQVAVINDGAHTARLATASGILLGEIPAGTRRTFAAEGILILTSNSGTIKL